MHGPGAGSLTTGPGEQVGLPFVLMRGGTSRAVVLTGSVLPDAGSTRDAVILSLFGSPDPRQVDGLGGADLLTSKLAIVDPPTVPGADLDYTFAQVSITEPVVDYDINCGNISAAVAAYAVDEGLVEATDPISRVSIHNTNTGRILRAEVPTVGGRAAVEGPLAVHGVPGTGAAIAMDFGATAGGVTGELLPTGRVANRVDTPYGPIEVTVMDLANVTAFFSAASVGMSGHEGPEGFGPDRLEAVAAVKAAAAALLDMDPDGLVPVPALVSAPSRDAPVHLVARVVGGRPPVLHKAYPGTLAACTGVAARIPGTTVHSVASPPEGDEVRIGHPGGVMPVRASVVDEGGRWRVERAEFDRTARRIAEGTAYVRRGSAQLEDVA